jgi:NAD(P)-dependent dehydrogenase (short-subunit alcohol dehydrogenase family)
MGTLFDLSGRVSIITGGTGVLGLEYAHALAEHGSHVVLVDLDQDRCDKCAAEIATAYGGQALGVRADVSNPNDVAALVGRVLPVLGQIDVLVNNAAAQPPGCMTPFEEYPLEVWNQVLAVNLTGQFLMAQAVGRVMLTGGRGSVINISSTYGVVGPDHRIYEGSNFNSPAVYAASKAGVLGLTRYLATYWGGRGIRVNAITPGGVFRGHEEPFLSRYSARVPMGRMANQQELRGAVVYLASDASSYVTGHNLVVDGGWTVW